MSQHHENTRILATQAFLSEWQNQVPILWPNDGRKKPSSGPWARFTITTGNTANAAVGGKLKRTVVVFGLQLHMPLDRGTREAYEICDAFLQIENRNFLSQDTCTTLKTRTATIQDVGIKDGYKIFTVTIDALADTETQEIVFVPSFYRQPGGVDFYLQPDESSKYVSP